MGNTNFIGTGDDIDTCIDTNTHDYANNYVDAEIINDTTCQNNNSLHMDEKISNTHDLQMVVQKHIKMYIIYQRCNGVSRTFNLIIKILDGILFIYVTDILNKNTFLAHVTHIHKEAMVNIDPNIKKSNMVHYFKYIQISENFKYISFPENGSVNIYCLTKLLNYNILEYVNSVGIHIILRSDGSIGTKIDVKDYVDHNIYPYKCILCKDKYVIVCSEYNQIKKIIVINYNDKIINELKSLDMAVNTTILKFSKCGNHIVIYNRTKNILSVYDMTEKYPIIKQMPRTIGSDTMLNTLCISDDGKFLFFVEKMMFIMYDILHNLAKPAFSLINILNPGINTTNICDIKFNTQDINFHLMDYGNFSDMTNCSNNECNNLYVLVCWNCKKPSVYYWIIRISDHGYDVLGPIFINMTTGNQIDYIYNNSNMFIYRTIQGNALNREITVYDLNKIIPIRYAGFIASEKKQKLNKLYMDKYKNIGSLVYKDIYIVGADDSKVKYTLSDYMMFLVSMTKSAVQSTDANTFQLKINANIYIYGATKSFYIFQDLLTGKINQRDIIDGIFTIHGSLGRHNTMAELMSHMYEFTRVIVLKESYDGDIDRSEINNLKSVYIGYVLLILVVKYYSMTIKVNSTPTSYVQSTRNIGDSNTINSHIVPIMENENKIINFDILDIFNSNFPALQAFASKSINLMLGTPE